MKERGFGIGGMGRKLLRERASKGNAQLPSLTNYFFSFNKTD